MTRMILFNRPVCCARTEQAVPRRASGRAVPESSQEMILRTIFLFVVCLMINLTRGQQLSKIVWGRGSSLVKPHSLSTRIRPVKQQYELYST